MWNSREPFGCIRYSDNIMRSGNRRLNLDSALGPVCARCNPRLVPKLPGGVPHSKYQSHYCHVEPLSEWTYTYLVV